MMAKKIYEHICLHCKKVFFSDSSILGHPRALSQKYCSCVCKGYGVGKIVGKARGMKSAATNAKNKTGAFHNPQLRLTICSLGGKSAVNKNRINKTGSFFNKELRNLSRIASHTSEARLKNSISHKGRHTSPHTEITKESRKNIILPKKDTSIEVKIQNYLKQLGLEFFTHKYMNIKHGYQCDIFIPNINMVIECDGNYWHNYPLGRDIDKLRTSELIEQGHRVLRFWESEIHQLSFDNFKKRLSE